MKKKVFIPIGLIAIILAVLLTHVYWTTKLKEKKTPISEYLNHQLKFEEKLFFPPNLKVSRIEKDNAKVFDLSAEKQKHTFAKGYTGETLGYNGLSYLGPSILVSKGDHLQINVKNHLDEITTVHWHGISTDGKNDGVVDSSIEPQHTWQANLSIDQDSESTFYHPHPMGTVASEVYYGLAGLFIITDDKSGPKLPNTLGLDDVPLIIQDRLFVDGNLTLKDDVVFGPTTNATIVNGNINPYFEVKTKRVRLRLYNADNAKTYTFSLSNPEVTMTSIAGDGGLLPEASPTKEISLGTGERTEVVLDFSKASNKTEIFLNSKRVQTISNGKELEAKHMMNMDEDSHMAMENSKTQEDIVPILLFKVSQSLLENEIVPKSLKPFESSLLKQYAEKKPDKSFILTHMLHMLSDAVKNKPKTYILSLDGRMDETPDFILKKNTKEVWEIENQDKHGDAAMDEAMTHSFHIHGLQFYILSVNGKEPPPNLRGLKDTINLKSGDTFKILIITKNNTGTFVYHCHILEHEEAGMMRYFKIE